MIAHHVTPEHAYYAGRPVHILTARPAEVQIIRRKTHGVVRRYRKGTAPVNVRWHGLGRRGGIAAGGRYAVRADGHLIGTFSFRGHRYPIRGPHADRGGIGYFGAPRSGGRTHEGFDVNAACGTPLVAARGGRVLRSVYDPVLYGNLVVIRGRRTGDRYWYAHLRSRPRVSRGDRVRTGQRIGSVGETGNARHVGCHLHFELRSGGNPFDPAPLLHRWDGWS